MKYTFTVFTPTFNRANKLSRVYNSLQLQTFKDFEWLIVDDGSNDNTKSLINGWLNENKLIIRYFFQENQGKHIAFNKGVKESIGEFFITLDSDDSCLPNALEILIKTWKGIPKDQIQFFSAVTGLCQDQNGNLIGDKYPTDMFDSNSLETFYKYKIKGEKWGFQKTEILKTFLFPDYIKNVTIQESYVWTNISREYKTRYINKILRVYFIDSSDSLIKLNLNPKKNLEGKVFNQLFKLNNHIDFFKYRPFYFFGTMIYYIRYSTHLNKSIFYQIKCINLKSSKLLYILCFLFGFLYYLNDELKNRFKR